MPYTGFSRPSRIVADQDKFGEEEVGINHPRTSAHFRLTDNGDAELVCGEGLGMIFHRANNSITLVADSVRFLTKENDGFRWNKLSFNPNATKYTEPAFVPYQESEIPNLFRGIDNFLELE